MPIEHWLQLSLTDGLGPILTARLISQAGSAEAACGASASLLQSVEGIGAGKSRQIAKSLIAARDEAKAELDRAAEVDCSMLCPDDADYPVALRGIPDPPSVLYVKGAFEPRDLHAIAIVGSRRCSTYGREQAARFAALLAGAGFTIVSGGARGIDSAAHRAAIMETHGRTIAVLGCGIDIVYPPENASLFEQIAADGAIVSECLIGAPPMKENFPRRNRIVSGLSRGVLVVEADTRSGALITARQAVEDHNRPVFALPGRVDNPLSAGPHALIRDGAILTTKLEDILDGLGPLPEGAHAPLASIESARSEPESAAAPALFDLTENQQRIVDTLRGETATVDDIIDRCALDPSLVLSELTMLSLRGVLQRVDGQRYQLR